MTDIKKCATCDVTSADETLFHLEPINREPSKEVYCSVCLEEAQADYIDYCDYLEQIAE